MAQEIFTQRIPASENIYFQIRRKSDLQIYNATYAAFEAFNPSNWGDYAYSMTEESTGNGFYTANFPSGFDNGDYVVTMFVVSGGSPAVGDATADRMDIIIVGGNNVQLSDIYANLGILESHIANTDLAPLHVIVDSIADGVTVDTTPPTIDTDAIADKVYTKADGVETGVTLKQVLRRLAAMLSKRSGAGTSTEKFRNPGDTVDVLTVTMDEFGNRSAVTVNDTY